MTMLVEAKAFSLSGTVLVDGTGAVWYTFSRPWWDISSWIWWLLMPGTKTWVHLRTTGGGVARMRVIRLSAEHVTIGSVNPPKNKKVHDAHDP